MNGPQDAAAGVAGHASAAAVREQLRVLVAEQGAAAVDDVGRCRNLIRDYCTADRGGANILIAALEDGVPADLRQPDAAEPPDRRAARLRERLKSDHGQTEAAARWAVESWILALGCPGGPPGRAPDAAAVAVATLSARPLWRHPAAPWTTALAVFVVATAVYSAFGSKTDADNQRLIATGVQLQDTLNEREFFPPSTIQMTTLKYPLRNFKGNTMTISINFQGDVGEASGTELDSGSMPKAFDWHLTLKSIETYLTDRSSDYVMQSDAADQSYISVHVKPDGDRVFKVCRDNNDIALDCFK